MRYGSQGIDFRLMADSNNPWGVTQAAKSIAGAIERNKQIHRENNIRAEETAFRDRQFAVNQDNRQNLLAETRQQNKITRQKQFTSDMADTLGRANSPEEFEAGKKAMMGRFGYLLPEEKLKAVDTLSRMKYSPELAKSLRGGGDQDNTALNEKKQDPLGIR